MFVIDKLMTQIVFTNNDILLTTDKDCELSNANLFLMFKCDKYYDILNDNMLKHIFNEMNIAELESYNKFPFYYDKLKYVYQKTMCKKEDLKEFINNYELSLSVAQSMKDIDLYNLFDIISDDTTVPQLVIVKKILGDNPKRTISEYIDDYIDYSNNTYFNKLGLSLGISKDYLVCVDKYTFLVTLQMKNLFSVQDILRQIIKLKKEILINEPDIKYFKSLVDLKYNSLMCNLFKTKIHTKRVFEHQMAFFNKTKNVMALYDIITILYIMKTPKLDTILKNNIVLLQNIQNSKLCERIIPMISNILLVQFVSDDTKEQIKSIFFNDLHIFIAKLTNKKFAVQKPNVVKRYVQNKNDKSICSICYDTLINYAMLCLSCNKYIACLPCFSETQKYYNINCIRCRK
jgi:hypothetical protein